MVEMSLSTTEERKRVQGFINTDHYNWIKEKVKDGTFASESHAVRRAVSVLIAHTEGKLLR